MSNYTFTFKKEDILVEVSSSDKEFIVSEFKEWVDSAEAYTKLHPSEKKTLEKVEKLKHAEGLTLAERRKLESSVKSDIKAIQAEKTAEVFGGIPTPTVNTPPVQNQDISQPQQSQVQNANSVTINSLQNQGIEQAQPIPETDVPDFEHVLEQKLENSSYVPENAKDSKFIEFLASKHTNDKLNYLVVTAFYFLQFEKIERFSLKQINSKLMQNIGETLDHTILQQAIAMGIAELVPDLTGVSEISEYRLTEKGEDYFINGLKE